jgi:hypothetical protein
MKSAKPKAARVPQVTIVVPHSWRIPAWPASVYPGDPVRGRRLCRTHQLELVSEGALTRIGREIVVQGANYIRWMAKQSNRVLGYDVPANRPEHAPKRGGRAQLQ